MTNTQAQAFAKALADVAAELAAYAKAIEQAGYDPNAVDWRWSTYAIDLQGLLFEQLKADGAI